MMIKSIVFSVLTVLLAGCASGAWQGEKLFDAGDYSASVLGLIELADKGAPVAEADLGYLYQYGQGEERDEDKAMELYRQAAAQGNARASTCMAVLLIQGETIPHDLPRAIALLEQAEAAGDKFAAYDLGYSYNNGIGVQKDPFQGARLIAKADGEVVEAISRWVMNIKSTIDRNKQYPNTAILGHYGGVVTVAFQLQGPFAKDARVVKSSGHADLDDVAIITVDRTYFPAPPPGFLMPNDFRVAINYIPY